MEKEKKWRAVLHQMNDWVSNAILVICLVFVALVGLNLVRAYATGLDFSVFGYRPAYILSGSMEPTIMTNSIVLTKQVTEKDTLQIGDIVSFTVDDNSGQKVRISHRIIEITDDGTVVTKGDNNNHADEYPLTRADIQSRIVGIWNGFATIVRFLNSKYGIPSLIGFTLAVCLFYYAAKCLFAKEPDDDVIEVEMIEDENTERID